MVNPAFTGLYKGWERLTVNHKSQWLNANTKFFTTALAVDFNLLKTPKNKGAFLGIGLQMYNDVGGDSKFGTKQIFSTISTIVPIAGDQVLALGFQAGMGQKSGSYENLIFSNQFDGNVFDPAINPQETNGLNSKIYPDLSVGFLYQYGGIHQRYRKSEDIVFNIGVSVYHFNTPTIYYNFGSFEELNKKLTLHSLFKRDFSRSYVGFEMLANHFRQGPHTETLLAALLRYKKSSGSQVTRLRKKVVLAMGMAYRVGDAVAPVFRIENGDWSFGMSYDITISKLGTYRRGGGLEFSLVYNNTNFALFKRRY